MQLFRAAKLISGLRLLIVTAAPIVTTSAALLSVRGAAYLAGAALGSIGVTLWPIILTLIAISGAINSSSESECADYYEDLQAKFAADQIAFHAAWLVCYGGQSSAPGACFEEGGVFNIFTPSAGCTPPGCISAKKVWLQTIWASPGNFATDSKSCFLIGYSYGDLDGFKIEYNPFKIPTSFLESRAMNPFLVFGNRFTNLNDSEWKNLESVPGWDKGYWKAEQTDVECRGWNPGWSRKVK